MAVLQTAPCIRALFNGEWQTLPCSVSVLHTEETAEEVGVWGFALIVAHAHQAAPSEPVQQDPAPTHHGSEPVQASASSALALLLSRYAIALTCFQLCRRQNEIGTGFVVHQNNTWSESGYAV